MKQIDYNKIFEQFDLDASQYNCQKIGKGHIHLSLKVIKKTNEQAFVLQNINTNVFKNPEQISSNWKRVTKHLNQYYPDYHFLKFIPTKNNTDFAIVESDGVKQYWRLLPYIENNRISNQANSLEQIYEAAFAFGNFTKMMHNCPLEGFYEVLDNFHNSAFRWKQFCKALENASEKRLLQAEKNIKALKESYWIVEKASKLQQKLPKRLQHMDAKIDNLLFVDLPNQKSQLIDLDTIMPANFLSDVGDLIRSTATDAAEDEIDENKIQLFTDRIETLRQGYLKAAATVLSDEEKQQFYFAGLMLVQMQTSRFLSDYLMNDVYYPVQYEEHNLVRAKNQQHLLNKLIAAYR